MFTSPARMWARKKCWGHMNRQLYDEYVERQAEFHAKTPKELRRENARMHKSEPHYNGVSNPGGARW